MKNRTTSPKLKKVVNLMMTATKTTNGDVRAAVHETLEQAMGREFQEVLGEMDADIERKRAS